MLIVTLLEAAVGVLAVGCAAGSKTYIRDPDRELADSSKVVLFVPLDSITVEYVDRTRAHPDTQFSDSFFLDAANSLFAYVASERFSLRSDPEELDESEGPFDEIRATRYSRIAGNTQQMEQAGALMKKTAGMFHADLILFAYSCKLKHIIYQPQPWRGGGPSYERPESYRAYAWTHVQIWNKQGKLLFEHIGANDAGRPIMYSLFGKKVPQGDMVKFAKHLYAPPLVRALYHSVQEAVKMGRQ
jgi:hypothetical protein